jgi:ABC-type Fe3+ transport system permease subunit
MLIIVTLGFTIAFTWRQTIFDTSQSIVNFFLHIQNSAALSILTSIFITLLAVLLVYLTAHLLKDDPESH